VISFEISLGYKRQKPKTKDDSQAIGKNQIASFYSHVYQRPLFFNLSNQGIYLAGN